MSETLRARGLAGVGWLGSSALIRGVAQIFSIAVLARLLEPSDFGIIASALVVANLAAAFSEMGVNAAVVQIKILSARFETIAQVFSLALSGLMALIVLLTAPAASAWFGMPELAAVLPWLSLGFVLKGISQVSEGKLNRDLGFKKLAGIEMGSFVLGYAVTAPLLALAGSGYWALVGAYLVQTLSQSVLCLLASPPRFEFAFDASEFRHILVFGNGLTVGRLFSYAALNLDNVIVGRWLGAELLGLYSRAYQILVMPAALIGQVISRVMFPVFSAIQDNTASSRNVFLITTAAFSLFIFPLQVLLISITHEIVYIILGPGWGGVAIILQILFATLFFRTAYKLNEALLKSAGAVVELAVSQAIYAALVGAGALFLIRYGVIGVSVAVAVSVFLYYVTLSIFVARRHHIRLSDIVRVLAPGMAIAAIMTVIVLASNSLPPDATPFIEAPRIFGVVAALLIWVLAIAKTPDHWWGQENSLALRQGKAIAASITARARRKVWPHHG